MTDEQMAKVPGGVQLLPMTAGEIVIGYNLPGGPEGPEAAARRLSGDLPRQDHQVERPEAQGGESRGRPCPISTSRWCAGRTPAGRPSCSPTHLAPISEEWKQGPGRRDHGELAEERQVRGLAQERRRHRHHQADPRAPSATSSTRSPSSPRSTMAQLQNRAGQFVGPGGEGGPAALASVQLPAEPARLGHRSRGRQVLPDRHLHLDALLQGEQGPEEGGGAAPDGRVLPDGRPEDERRRWATSRCPRTSWRAVRKASASIQ